MILKKVIAMVTFAMLASCATGPQKLDVSPNLMLEALNGLITPIELVISDKREDKDVLGYRNAKNQGVISFTDSVAKSLGETVQAALVNQGVEMSTGEQPSTRLEIQIHDLRYFTPDESWVSTIEITAEILLVVNRGTASIKKRFSSNRKQDVVTAPNKEFNEQFMNAILSELLNKALNDKEVITFLK
jgi:uncharacterized lipoprotein YajG